MRWRESFAVLKTHVLNTLQVFFETFIPFAVNAYLRYASSESIWEKRYFADMCRLLLEWKAFPELRDGHGQV